MERQDLRKAGLKVTLPRLKVLEILETSDLRHMSAEDVYKALLDMGEEIGLATVYRVLTQFEGAGLVSRLSIEGGHAVFELQDGSHHDHLLCVRCGKIEEFFDEVIEQRQKAIAKEKGWEMTDHSLYIYGICQTCLREE
ncbi:MULTISPECIES: ferric iron uptake transcriptional regulator [Methylophaga]|jgi:Fur family ferric uptake transcriptional regulator|uniref:Ferric uptake regulation protein n=1 Tax=Methylophaga marina TaxID=45495 RepID=A0ABP3DP52_9GAMM|nr:MULTISPECIES: ferric iron uptake transcriptional regulator [Methylophaga]MAX52827.1 ferric iron uptake transcriptional regulator [Methylophaga sp.]BDZ74900.1 transcriptional repressor [Methylophaga marina]|tara:strand:- start:8616 stop:9032 length:417 start_codon:yes stop_codon:yes gene_type:complete